MAPSRAARLRRGRLGPDGAGHCADVAALQHAGAPGLFFRSCRILEVAIAGYKANNAFNELVLLRQIRVRSSSLYKLWHHRTNKVLSYWQPRRPKKSSIRPGPEPLLWGSWQTRHPEKTSQAAALPLFGMQLGQAGHCGKASWLRWDGFLILNASRRPPRPGCGTVFRKAATRKPTTETLNPKP